MFHVINEQPKFDVCVRTCACEPREDRVALVQTLRPLVRAGGARDDARAEPVDPDRREERVVGERRGGSSRRLCCACCVVSQHVPDY